MAKTQTRVKARGEVPLTGMSAKDALIPASPRKRGEALAGANAIPLVWP
jgi:hypothetical protein